jgi:hypothetical protein
VGLLDNFERGLERAVNGAFAKTFKSGLAPIEITSALRRELDTKAAVVSRERILVPNKFLVRLGRTDYQRMTGIGPTLIDELTQLVQTHATGLSEGMIRVDSENVKGEVIWTPVLDVAGRRYPIMKARTVIGRGGDADITIDDTGTSRKHVEVLWDGKRAQVNDLGSTNGSQLNGEPLTKALLDPDSIITIGRTRIVFRVLAQSADVDQPSTRLRSDRERGTGQ